ncbi:MAG: hypothetical protein ACREAU_00095 [Nitrosopumilaceae archaeon]
MKLLTELIGFGKTRVAAGVPAEEDPAARLERIRAKAARGDELYQKQQAITGQEGGIADPRKARALMVRAGTASATGVGIPKTPQEMEAALGQFKSEVTRLLSSYTGKARLEQIYQDLRKQGDDPFIKAKRQIAFNAMTSGGRGNFEDKKYSTNKQKLTG